MRNRGVGGVLVILWLATSIAVAAQSGLLYLNGEPLSLAHPTIRQESSILVPLEEIGPFIGLEISISEGRIVLRGAGFRQAFDEALFYVQDGTAYVSLDWIIGLVNAKSHNVGGDIYIRTTRPEIVEVEASADQVTVRLTGFAPHELSVSQQGLSEIVRVYWPHSQLSVDPQLIRVGESDIQDVRIVGLNDGVELSISLESGTILGTEQLETDDFYALTIRVAERVFQKSIIELGDGIAIHEWSDSSEGCSIDYVYVESWRDRFRLAPTVSASGHQSTTSLSAILKENAAISAISVDCPWDPPVIECLIMDGIPYLIPDAPSEVLSIDLFGRWTMFSSLCSVGIKHAGQLVAVDGVNRPLAYGEVITYAPGYTGSIARGIPGSFTAIKIRENRVVSVYQGPFVPADSSAILVVASGEAQAELSLIQLGDPIEMVCQFLHAEGTYPYAVSAGPLVMGDGAVTLSGDQRDEFSELAGGTVLACDWQGGLYLLAFAGQDACAPGQPSWSLIDILHSLPTSLKDAVLLSSCGRNALAYSGSSGTFQLGSHDPIRLALSLIPLTP